MCIEYLACFWGLCCCWYMLTLLSCSSVGQTSELFFLARSLSGLAYWRLQDLESVWVLIVLGDQKQLDF